MAKPSKAVTEFMAKYNIASDEIWEVHGSTWVVKHKALERVAVEVGVVWLRPSVQLCDPAAKTAVICAFGKLGDREEWSFGEASPANNKNSYPVAMAEKRARDRVILKLLVTHGALYSESEADEFEQPRQNPHVTRAADILPQPEYDQHGEVIDNIPEPDADAIVKTRVVDQRPIFAELQKELQSTGSPAELAAWGEANKNRLGKLSSNWRDMLRGVYKEHQDALRVLAQGDDMRMAG
jgi:hypothetical protein